jgi:proteic killer suppression protein
MVIGENVDVTFASKKLQKICASANTLIRAYGIAGARIIQQRLMVLRSATSLATFTPYRGPERCHALTGNRKGQWAMDLHNGNRLVFRCRNHPIPQRADGGIAWQGVTAIEILEVIDYHD